MTDCVSAHSGSPPCSSLKIRNVIDASPEYGFPSARAVPENGTRAGTAVGALAAMGAWLALAGVCACAAVEPALTRTDSARARNIARVVIGAPLLRGKSY